MSTRRRTLLGSIGIAVIPAAAVGALAACGSSNHDDSRPGTVTAASSVGNADPLKASGLAIGVGDKPGSTLVTRPTPDLVTARCHGQGDSLMIDVTAPNGWHAVLKNGSQTVTVENSTLKYPSADLATPAGAIELSRTLSGRDFPIGVTWGQPAPGDVEVQVGASAPASWTVNGPNTDFLMYMHVSCG